MKLVMNNISPQYFEVTSIGQSSLGFISVAEFPTNLPFEIKRVYWTYYTPQNVIRGYHAHQELHQLIFAVSGTITFYTEDRTGHKAEFVLSEPNKGIHLPPYVWREIKFSHNAVLLCLASQEYREKDYIRDYESFKNNMSAKDL
jgi:dTDP-4-dehydrorhamnose 3,5-epimerase-like enzyme